MPNYSYARSSRLTRAEEYRQVFKNNYRISDNCFTFLICKQKGKKPRIGFAIAKKQIKGAVDRNRIKRQIRESFRLKQNLLPNFDIVVMVRKEILKLDNQGINDRLGSFWLKVTNRCENY